MRHKLCWGWRKKKDGKFAPSDHLPSFIFRIMIPWYLLIFENFWNFNKASQVYTLSVSDDNFLLLNTCITYIIRIVSNILLWHSSAQRAAEIETEKRREGRKKKYIIKYKANKLCCYIDVHIWYKNFVNKKKAQKCLQVSLYGDEQASKENSTEGVSERVRQGKCLWFMIFKNIRVHFSLRTFSRSFQFNLLKRR